jgi:CubicO group peptidase (beta-lactamase class C family)
MRSRLLLMCGPAALSLFIGCGRAAQTADAGATDDQGASADLGPTAAEQAAFDSLVKYANDQLNATGTPGASVAVVLHGRLMFAAGIGKKRYDQPDPVTSLTRFRAASLSKMILAATAMSHVEEGKLDLQEPITTYLPWFALRPPFDASAITTAMLLTHTSGFPCDTIPQCSATSSGPRQGWFADAANAQPLWAPPGAIYDYSNTGFALASVVLTAAAGVPDTAYEQLVHDRVFQPAGMGTATYDVDAAENGDFATGHVLDSKGQVVSTTVPDQLDCPLLAPPGGLLATPSDYAHFIEALLAGGGKMLKATSVAEMEAPHTPTRLFDGQGYGYAIESEPNPYAPSRLLFHGGSLPGYLSVVFIIPDLQFGIVVMANTRGGSGVIPDDLAVAALPRFFPQLPRKWPTGATDPSQWTGYPGTYSDPYGQLGTVTVSLQSTDGGAPGLIVDAPGAKDYSGKAAPIHGAMIQEGTDVWSFPDQTEVTFFPTDAGVYDRLVTRRGVALRP